MKFNSFLPIQNDGFSLIETLIVTGVMSVIIAGISGTMVMLAGMQQKTMIRKSAAEVSYDISSLIKNDLSWRATVDQATAGAENSPLLCIKLNTDANQGNDMDCSGQAGNFNLYDANGDAVYQPWDGDMTTANTNGFTEDGQLCNTFDGVAGNNDCPFRMELSWTAVCGAGFCLTPEIQITGTLLYSPTMDRRVVLNTANYSLGFTRGAENDLWAANGINIFREFGDVGIGNNAPADTLHVSEGGVRISSDDTNPNLVTINSENFAGASDGTYLSVNSSYNGASWVKTSTNAANTAMFMRLATSKFSVRFGNAVNGGGANPGTEVLTVNDAGNVGVGAEAPAAMLQVGSGGNQGNLRVEGTVTTCTIGDGVGATNCTSDMRLKKNIIPIQHSLDKIKKIRGVYYNWIESFRQHKGRQMGVLAQEVEKVFPEAVKTDSVTNHKMVDFTSLIFPLLEATKEISDNCESTAKSTTETLNELVRSQKQMRRQLNSAQKTIEDLRAKLKGRN